MNNAFVNYTVDNNNDKVFYIFFPRTLTPLLKHSKNDPPLTYAKQEQSSNNWLLSFFNRIRTKITVQLFLCVLKWYKYKVEQWLCTNVKSKSKVIRKGNGPVKQLT